VTGFKLHHLKKIRVLLSLLFFIPISILFLDPQNSVPEKASNFFTSFQIIPSLTKLFVYIGWTTLGLVAVVLLTLLFGRVYCSTLCPLGTFQDFIIRIRKKTRKKERYKFVKPSYKLHYTIFAFITALAFIGSMTLLNLLEPFSNFGRMAASLVEPLITILNNFGAGLIGHFNWYFLYNVPLRSVDTDTIAYPLFFLLLIGYLSYKHGRLFCNLLCPAGALLGLLSRMSLYNIIVDDQNCNYCGACERVCKANCIHSDEQKIDFPACVGCFNCINACPTGGVIFARKRADKTHRSAVKFTPSRRRFVRDLITPALGTVLYPIAQTDSSITPTSGYDTSKNIPISPPGSKSIERFSNLCTACNLCVSACPAQVLYPSFLHYGFAGIFQPMMNYNASYCNYECNICSRICPTGAILPLTVEQKKLVQIGKSTFFKDDCVVVSKKKDCAACSEHCPTKAVYMVHYEDNLRIPELNNDICVGCGACEHACPTIPRKAIYITANKVHAQAKKPEVKKQGATFDSSKDFPF
jgi:ferredoxin